MNPRYVLAFSVPLAACGDAESTAPACRPVSVDLGCTPAYEPTYDAIYATTFRGSCARGNVTCHAATGKQGGLDFSEAEAAYRQLLGRAVVAGQPGCSDLVRRLASTDGNVRMPPAVSLSAGEQCAVVQWIERGAPR